MFFAVALVWVGLAANQGAPPDVAAGATLFQRSCASCHSVEGRAPSLATGVFTHGGEDAQIAQTIRAGVPGTQMPPFPALSADGGPAARRVHPQPGPGSEPGTERGIAPGTGDPS